VPGEEADGAASVTVPHVLSWERTGLREDLERAAQAADLIVCATAAPMPVLDAILCPPTVLADMDSHLGATEEHGF